CGNSCAAGWCRSGRRDPNRVLSTQYSVLDTDAIDPDRRNAPMTPDPPTAPPTADRSTLAVVWLVVVIDLLGFGIVLPLLPGIAEDFLDPLLPGGSHSTLGGFVVGVLYSSFSAMQVVFAPIWGRLSDRIGRRPILLLGLAGSVVFYFLFGVGSQLGAGEAKLL